MSASPPVVRRGEYAARGDYHRVARSLLGLLPDLHREARRRARAGSTRCRAATRVLDAGCGEGVLVDEYAGPLAIEGLDRELLVGPGAHRIAHRAALR